MGLGKRINTAPPANLWGLPSMSVLMLCSEANGNSASPIQWLTLRCPSELRGDGWGYGLGSQRAGKNHIEIEKQMFGEYILLLGHLNKEVMEST